MPEPSTTEGRRIQGELKNLLEDAAVRRAESSASRRQGYPSEHRAATSRFMLEASIHTRRTRNTAPAAPGRLGNEHPHRNRRTHLDERVHRGYHPRRGGRYDSGEDRSCHTRFWKVNRMRTMYVPGSEIHVHSDYINDSS
jgi:hypothetical protein